VAPAIVGSNCTFKIAAWPGASVSGKLPPEIVKPVPVRAPLTVTAVLPVEERISGCTTGEFTGTVPKATLAELMLSPGTEASNCSAKLCATPPTLAVKVTA
jgi:hypothetical protein